MKNALFKFLLSSLKKKAREKIKKIIFLARKSKNQAMTIKQIHLDGSWKRHVSYPFAQIVQRAFPHATITL